MYDWSLDTSKLKPRSTGGIVTRSSNKKMFKLRKPCSDLNMDEYVSNVNKKAGYKIHMLSKIRRYITGHAASLIYK